MYPEIRIVRIAETIGRYRSGALSCIEASEVLGMSERHFRRLRDRYEAAGAEGIVDRRLGRASSRRVPVDEIEWVLELFRTRYWDFTVKHFQEHLERDHGFKRSYSWTKARLHEAGLVKPAKPRGTHRKKRPRRALPGMLVFQDGSPHRWLVGLGRDLDLIATMDDATGEVLSAFLVEEEGTLSSFRGLREVIERKGLFCAFYTDRGSHYFHTSKAGGRSTRTASPRSAGRWANWASSISRPIHPRPGAASSASLGPCRSACPRNSGWPGSPGSAKPTAISPRPSCPPSIDASWSRPPIGARPSWLMSAAPSKTS